MVEERPGGGHGEAGESPDPEFLLDDEQAEQIEKAPGPPPHARSRAKSDSNPQTERRLKDLINKSAHDPIARDRLRAHAAVIAVDMERGIYKRDKSKRWIQGTFSITEIMRAIGYYVRDDGKRNSNPIIFREPEWSRAVEWERIKRDASYRMEIDGLMPLMRVGLNAMLLQIIERAMTRPETIPDHVLFPETRKMLDLVAEFGKQKKDSELDNMMAKFMETVKGLPEGARDIALQAFQVEVRALFSSTENAKTILQSIGATGKGGRGAVAEQRVDRAEKEIWEVKAS